MVNKLKLIVLICVYVEEQVNCGDAIRLLEYALTKKKFALWRNLSIYDTKGQEISCYGHEGLGNKVLFILC